MKIINSKFYEDTGLSIVKIGTKLGEFVGISILHPDDKKIKSRFFGCKLAELRAYKQYFKKNNKKLKNELEVLSTLLKDLDNIKGIDIKSKAYRFIKKKFFIKQKELIDNQNKIEKINNAIEREIKNYPINLEKTKKKIEQIQKKYTETK